MSKMPMPQEMAYRMMQAALRREQEKNKRLREQLEALVSRVVYDRHEPDKLLCHVQSTRGFLLREEGWVELDE